MKKVALVGLVCLLVACSSGRNNYPLIGLGGSSGSSSSAHSSSSTSGSGGSNTGGSSGTGGSTSTGGTGGQPADAGSDADAGVCVDTPDMLPDGALGPTNCGCETEAAANVQAMADAVVAAFKAKGVLCASALGVPVAGPPPAKKYQPSHSDFADFHTGDDTTGWKCLGFALVEPIHCRYSYGVGSGYVGPTVGGPNPGAMGFEVAAQGDSDGDGVRSTYTITGTIDPITGDIVLTPLFTDLPLE
ncbi:MAG: hypothetical protein QM820_02360 [Minicystis sp.]